MNPLIIGLIIYSLVILGVGIRAARLNRTLDDYLLADRRLGPWVAAFSERASGESAWLLIGLPGLAFATGVGTVWVGIGCCTGIAFSWFVVARRLREETERLGSLTLADYFRRPVPGPGPLACALPPRSSSCFSSLFTSPPSSWPRARS